MKNKIVYIFVALLLIGCNPVIFNIKTKACFDYSSHNELKTSDTIKFSNCSENSNYYFWVFGDGSHSYEKEPKHIFRLKQSYLVKLFVANRPQADTTNIQESDTISKIINISIGVPKACFDILPSIKLKTSDTIKFSNCSENSNYYFWDFGDGTTSTEVNPNHVYNSAGLFTVKLIASNESKSDSIIKIINVDDIISLNKTMTAESGESEFNIDVDGNNIVDFQISKYSHTGTTQQFYCTIKAFNGYEIFSDSIFTDCLNTSMPIMYLFGDTIQNSIQTQTQVDLYYYFSRSMKLPCKNDSRIKDEIIYVGFRKQSENKVKLGWIKLKVSGVSTQATVTLYSFKIPLETDILLIDK